MHKTGRLTHMYPTLRGWTNPTFKGSAPPLVHPILSNVRVEPCGVSGSPVEHELHQRTYLLMVLLCVPAQSIWSNSQNTCNTPGRLGSDSGLDVAPTQEVHLLQCLQVSASLVGLWQRRVRASKAAYCMLRKGQSSVWMDRT